MAYENMDSIIDSLEDTADIMNRLLSVYQYKANQ